MNERIQELIQNTAADLDRGPLDRSQDTDAILREFAELIVRECADIADINAHQHESPGLYVRQHFGIEGE